VKVAGLFEREKEGKGWRGSEPTAAQLTAALAPTSLP